MDPAKRWLGRTLERLEALFGRGLVVTLAAIALAALAVSAAAFLFVNTAAPSTLTISGGPPGSAFQRWAEQYQKILARDGVTLKVLPSDGSADNLRRLRDRGREADIGFVLGGEPGSAEAAELVSLGSVAYQPLMIFHRGGPKRLLSEFKGLRIDIGPEGSGTHALALRLLKANGVEPGDGTRLVDTAADDTVKALHDGRIDAFFAMSDSTPSALIRQLLRSPDIHLYDVVQADAYVRRVPQLNRLHLPRGAIDLGEDIPAADVQLVGPSVELVAREGLHPALSDLLLEAAREVHGRPGLYRKRGEFPAPLGHELRISADAQRYYASGKGFLYRSFPFWLASLIARLLAVLVPLVLLAVPAFRIVPVVYRWHMSSRIYRWYGALQKLEREALAADAGRRAELLARLDDIERAVLRIAVPSAFGDLLYGLRAHVADVRAGLSGAAADQANTSSR